MKILVADGVSREGIDLLSRDFEVVVRDKLPAAELMEIIGQFDALIVRSQTKVTREVLEKAVKLRAVGRAGVGVDNIDIEAATQKGVIVLNAPEGNTMAATEHTMAMMLTMARNIAKADASMRAGEWKRGHFMGVEIRGKTLGVIGLGRIGSGVAKRAVAMEMKVIGYDPYVNAERVKNLGIETAALDEIYARADFITFHMPLTAQTKYMINQDNIARLKPGVRLINCARGGIIEEAALAEGLKSGVIAGAAIDVFEKEPFTPENPLYGLDQLVLTPHLGASTVEAQVGVAVDVAQGVMAALRGEPVTTAVNMAPVAPHVLKFIKPYFSLAERMGCMAIALAEGPVGAVEVEYNGDLTNVDATMITTAVLKGLLGPILLDSVNYVNAPGLAKERHIKVKEIKNKENASFANLISVRVRAGEQETVIQGTLFGEEERIVTINGHRVDVDPRSRILLCPHINRPGVIGRVGSLMGASGINISSMQVSKTKISGVSIMALAIDHDIPEALLAQIRVMDGIFDAKIVNFETL